MTSERIEEKITDALFWVLSLFPGRTVYIPIVLVILLALGGFFGILGVVFYFLCRGEAGTAIPDSLGRIRVHAYCVPFLESTSALEGILYGTVGLVIFMAILVGVNWLRNR